MADLVVTDPRTGQRFRVRGAPQGMTQEQAQQAYEQQNPAPTPASTGGAGGATAEPSGPSTASTVAAGLAHGPFSMVEGVSQLGNRAGVENLGERIMLNPLNPVTGPLATLAGAAGFGPAQLHRGLGQLGDYANQTTAGSAADIVGSILPALIPVAGEAQAPVVAGRIAQFLQRFPRAAGFVERAVPALKGMLTGGTSAALQPAPEDDRFWHAKAAQFGLGAFLPGLGATLTTPIGSKVASRVSAWMPAIAAGMYGHGTGNLPLELMVLPTAAIAKEIQDDVTRHIFSPRVGGWLTTAARTQQGVGAAGGQAVGRGLGTRTPDDQDDQGEPQGAGSEK